MRPAAIIALFLGFAVAASGCDSGGASKSVTATTNGTVATTGTTTPRERPLSTAAAARAVAKHLRGDPRLPVVDIDCREHEDSDRVLCNVEFDDACDMFRVVREPDGELSLGRPEVSLCTYSTFSGFPG